MHLLFLFCHSLRIIKTVSNLVQAAKRKTFAQLFHIILSEANSPRMLHIDKAYVGFHIMSFLNVLDKSATKNRPSNQAFPRPKLNIQSYFHHTTRSSCSSSVVTQEETSEWLKSIEELCNVSVIHLFSVRSVSPLSYLPTTSYLQSLCQENCVYLQYSLQKSIYSVCQTRLSVDRLNSSLSQTHAGERESILHIRYIYT